MESTADDDREPRSPTMAESEHLVRKKNRFNDQPSSFDMSTNEDDVLIRKDISRLSSIGIFSHSFHLLDDHFRLFMYILLLVVIPTLIPWKRVVSLIQSTDDFSNALSQNSTRNHTHITIREIYDPIPGTIETGTEWRAQFQVSPLAATTTVGVYVAWEFLAVALLIVRRFFVAYSAGRIQVGKRATIVDAWHGFHDQWKRVLWTGICERAIWLAAGSLSYAPSVLLDKAESGAASDSVNPRVNLLYWVTGVTVLLSFTIVRGLRFAFQLATFVSVLDGTWGFKAFGRGWRLLQGRMRVAVGIWIFSHLAWMANKAFFSFVMYQAVHVVIGLKNEPVTLARPLSGSLWGRKYFVFMNFAFSLGMSPAEVIAETLYAVFCMSCMAFHRESIATSSFFQALTKNGCDHDC